MVQVSLGILVTIAVAAFFFLLERLTSTLRDISDTLTEINESVSNDLDHIHNDIEGVEEQLRETNNLLHRVDARGDGGILGKRESGEAPKPDSEQKPTENQGEHQAIQRKSSEPIEDIIDEDSLFKYTSVGEPLEEACVVLSGATTDGKRILIVEPARESAQESLHGIWGSLLDLSLIEGVERMEFRIGKQIFIKFGESADVEKIVEAIENGVHSEPYNQSSTTSVSEDNEKDTDS